MHDPRRVFGAEQRLPTRCDRRDLGRGTPLLGSCTLDPRRAQLCLRTRTPVLLQLCSSDVESGNLEVSPAHKMCTDAPSRQRRRTGRDFDAAYQQTPAQQLCVAVVTAVVTEMRHRHDDRYALQTAGSCSRRQEVDAPMLWKICENKYTLLHACRKRPSRRRASLLCRPAWLKCVADITADVRHKWQIHANAGDDTAVDLRCR